MPSAVTMEISLSLIENKNMFELQSVSGSRSLVRLRFIIESYRIVVVSDITVTKINII